MCELDLYLQFKIYLFFFLQLMNSVSFLQNKQLLLVVLKKTVLNVVCEIDILIFHSNK